MALRLLLSIVQLPDRVAVRPDELAAIRTLGVDEQVVEVQIGKKSGAGLVAIPARPTEVGNRGPKLRLVQVRSL